MPLLPRESRPFHERRRPVGGRPAEEQTGDRCAIQRGSGTKKELPEIHHATREIPPIRFGFRCSRAEVGQRFEQGTVLAAVAGIEIGHGIVDRMLEQYCGAIVQRMSAGSLLALSRVS